MKKIGKYRILTTLGTGGFGIVYLGEHEGQKYAIKVSKETREYILERFFKEAAKLNEIRKKYKIPYLVDIKEIMFDQKAYVMEYLPDDPIAYYKNTEDIDFIARIVDAVSQLHSIGIVHRDIKPENIRVKNNIPILLDFGVASWRDSQTGLSFAGTECYMPPEYFPMFDLSAQAGARLSKIRGSSPREQVKNMKKLHDVFSMGLTIGVIVTGEMPFSGCNKSIKAEYLNKGSKVLENWYKKISPKNIRDLVIEATTFFPDERPFAETLIQKYCPQLGKKPESSISIKHITPLVEEGPYTCLDCGKTTDPPANFCQHCGSPFKYVALHIITLANEVKTSNLPDGVKVVRYPGISQLFSHTTILIDVKRTTNWELIVGRKEGNIMFSNDPWMSSIHGKLIKKSTDIYFTDDVNGHLPRNLSRYNNIVIGKRQVLLDAGGYLSTGSTVFLIEKYFKKDELS